MKTVKKLPIIFILFSLLISCKEKKTNDKTEDNPNKKIINNKN